MKPYLPPQTRIKYLPILHLQKRRQFMRLEQRQKLFNASCRVTNRIDRMHSLLPQQPTLITLITLPRIKCTYPRLPMIWYHEKTYLSKTLTQKDGRSQYIVSDAIIGIC